MPKFAVGFFSLFTNELHIEIIDAPTWREAAMSHSKTLFVPDETNQHEGEPVPYDIEEARRSAFDMDGAFDVKEIVP